jgi:hypothetical protein
MTDKPENAIELGETEIHFNDETQNGPRADTALLPNGWVKAVVPQSYQVEYYPPEKIDTIHTHTSADPLTNEESLR